MATTLDERKLRGAWATPAWLVERVLDVALDPLTARDRRHERLRVLDPACGDGRFLAAAGRRADLRLEGVEVDAGAAAAARAALGDRATIREGDALDLLAADDPGYDLVVGNPPYLNQLAAATTRGGRSRHGGGPYADAAVEFLALALRLARPDGGRVALVLPQSVLASRDAAPVRRSALDAGRVDAIWTAGEAVFDAAVHTVAVVLVRGEQQGAVRRWHGPAWSSLPDVPATDLASRPTWSHLVAGAAGVPAVAPRTCGTVGDRAGATAGFRSQFYGLVPYVTESAAEAPLVTAGLLDPGRCVWGERPARFAGQRFERPGVDLDRLAHGNAALAAWVAARRVPKVLVATQTAVLEAAVDPAGTWVPSVPVISVEPHPGVDVWEVGAVLGSPVASAWAATAYFGAGLGAALKLSAGQVRTMPWPAGDLAEAAARLRAGDVDGAAAASTRAYGVEAGEVLEWWRGRVRGARPRRARASGC